MKDLKNMTDKKIKRIIRTRKIITWSVLITVLLAVSFFGTAGLVWLICWAIKRQWSWRLCVAVWCVLFLLGSTFKGSGGRK